MHFNDEYFRILDFNFKYIGLAGLDKDLSTFFNTFGVKYIENEQTKYM